MQVTLPDVETRASFEVCGDEVNGERPLSDVENGAQLGWLIDAGLRTVCVYRPGRPAEELQGIDHIVGEGPVVVFRLELEAIWEGV
jgi:Uma2 family endonuclease